VSDETARIEVDMELSLEPVAVRLVGDLVQAASEVHGPKPFRTDEQEVTCLLIELPEQVPLVDLRIIRGLTRFLEPTDADPEVPGPLAPQRLAELVAQAQRLGSVVRRGRLAPAPLHRGALLQVELAVGEDPTPVTEPVAGNGADILQEDESMAGTELLGFGSGFDVGVDSRSAPPRTLERGRIHLFPDQCPGPSMTRPGNADGAEPALDPTVERKSPGDQRGGGWVADVHGVRIPGRSTTGVILG
jgi:hypothetical protein